MSEAKKNVSFSLAGCGFLGIYHIGAATCLVEHVPHLVENARFAGASAGALIACSLICQVPMNNCVDFTLRLARSSGEHPLGGWEPNVKIEAILRNCIDLVLPANAHELCTNRLFVSVTTLVGLKNQIISEFKTRKDLIDVLMCSAFVPAFSNYTVPKYGDQYLLDGGLSDNLPVFDADTITICPWAGEHSICPRDPEGQSFPLTMLNMSICPSAHNLARFKDAFFAPKPETLKNYCWQGYDDALLFLSENQLIHCNVHRVLAVLTNLEHRVQQDCSDCEHHRDHARNSQLSQEMLAHWTESEGWKQISRCSSVAMALTVTPVKKMLAIWMLPVAMLKDFIIQLFMLAYFRADKIRHGGLSAEVIRLVKKLQHPKALLWELCVATASKVFLSSAEFWISLTSNVVAVAGSLRSAKRMVCGEPCRVCGHRLDRSPGPVTQDVWEKEKKEREEEKQNAATVVAGEVMEVVVLPQAADREEATVPQIIVEEPSYKAEVTPELDRAGEVKAVHDEEGDPVAVWLDIHADSVEVAIPVPKHDDHPADSTTPTAETLRVEGVGEIKEVVIDPVLVNQKSEGTADSVEGGQGQNRLEQRPAKAERIHKYVHKFEQYKNVMTLHYIDENQQRRTESLFVEKLGSDLDTSEDILGSWTSLTGSQQGTSESGQEAVARPMSMDDVENVEELSQGPSKKERKEEAGRLEEGDHNVEKELTRLLEDKLFIDQRRFEKDYESSHQRRLKRKGMKELKSGTGHYSLQLIGFNADAPTPSPAISPCCSLRNVSTDDGLELVRSVSDACSLASTMHKFRDQHKRQMSQRNSLSMSQGNLNMSKQFPSLQSLASASRPMLVKSQSDTSDIAASLRMLKKLRGSARENKVTGPQMTHVPTAPVLSLDETASSFAINGTATLGQSQAATCTPLPIIHDVSSPDVHLEERNGAGPVPQSAMHDAGSSPSGTASSSTTVREGCEATVRASGSKLERSHNIRSSHKSMSRLLSRLKHLRSHDVKSTCTPQTRRDSNSDSS